MNTTTKTPAEMSDIELRRAFRWYDEQRFILGAKLTPAEEARFAAVEKEAIKRGAI